jgi:antitoxin component of MazEF toxin-antitoxin module
VQARVEKWDGSIALRIPEVVAAAANLVVDSMVDVSVVGGKLVIAPTASVTTLDDLVAAITPLNSHKEVDTGTAVGNEAW